MENENAVVFSSPTFQPPYLEESTHAQRATASLLGLLPNPIPRGSYHLSIHTNQIRLSSRDKKLDLSLTFDSANDAQVVFNNLGKVLV